jgi:tetratricopeptide (TPR) repeat protein/tRNA A-37 threonylcarbamoyl transferase component Bud32
VGELLAGRFSVLRFIAKGGMGAVYEATDVLLRTHVALKIIRGRIATDATAMERFRREVLLARRISHANICRVYELYEATTARGIPIHFLTMELLEGESLARRLSRKGRMTTDEALPIVRQMCDGLDAAHAEGVIHRDFKSSNVMLVPRASTGGEKATESTRVVITDFGVARALHLATEEPEEGPLTGRGILGTPEYMAPEQVTGGEVTPATDIYALGVVMYEMVTGKLPFAGDTPLAAAARRLDEPPPRPETTVPGLDKRWAVAIVRCLARQPERRFTNARDIIPALDRKPPRPRYTLPIAVGAALALILGAYGLVKYRPSLRLKQPQQRAVLAAPRTAVAILGFGNELGSPKLSWLPTAVSELLAHELSAAETSLRVIDTDRVDLERRSLGVAENDVGDEKTQQRLEAALGASILVYGTLSPSAPGSDDLRLRVQAIDAQSRKELASIEETLGASGALLTEAVPRLAVRLRTALGVSLTDDQETALAASRVHSVDAAQVYAEGVMRERLWELEDARDHFEAAVAADSSSVDAQRRIGETWVKQGNRKAAREVIERLRARPSGLTARQAAELEARALGLGPDERKAADAWTALFEAMPDDVQVGEELLQRLPPRAKLALVKRLRQLPAHSPLDLDILEAKAAWASGEMEHAEELLDRAGTRATELGARWELGRVRVQQSWLLFLSNRQRWNEAVAREREAEQLFAQVGELDELADAKRGSALLLSDMGSRREALAALDDAAGVQRRIGARSAVAELLLVSADVLKDSGKPDLASKKLDEARAELEKLEAPPDKRPFTYYFRIRAELAIAEGDLHAAQDAIRKTRTDPDPWFAENLEARVLYEQDHREEARAAFLRAGTLAEQAQSHLIGSSAPVGACAVDCEGAQPAAGVACLAQHCQPGNALCRVVEAQCRYRSNDLAGAEVAARDALQLYKQRGDDDSASLADRILMRIAAARGESARAIRALQADLARAESKHDKPQVFEVTLALGDVELMAGRPEGRARLLKLEQEAKSREFFRIARLTREALDQKPVSSAAPRH